MDSANKRNFLKDIDTYTDMNLTQLENLESNSRQNKMLI